MSHNRCLVRLADDELFELEKLEMTTENEQRHGQSEHQAVVIGRRLERPWMKAKIGDVLNLGLTNFGREYLYLPVTGFTKTMIVCSDGDRTERVMKSTGRRWGHPRSMAAKVVAQ